MITIGRWPSKPCLRNTSSFSLPLSLPCTYSDMISLEDYMKLGPNTHIPFLSYICTDIEAPRQSELHSETGPYRHSEENME